MIFHCLTRHGFASASVMHTGDLIDVDVKCQGNRIAVPGVRFMIRFHAPRVNRVEGVTPDKYFALLGLSHFNRSLNLSPRTSVLLPYDDLVLDESLILSESI